MELLAAHHLTRLVAGRPLFAPLDLRLADGHRVALVGPNGTGKSTALALLAGEQQPDDGGVVRAPGIRVGFVPQDDRRPAGSGTVWQVAARALDTVREAEARVRLEERRLSAGAGSFEAYEGAVAHFERAGGYGAEARLRAVLAAVGLGPALWDREATELSGGEARRLSLAAALGATPDVLLLDEPTNHLDLGMRTFLQERLAGWRGALVVVSHDRDLLDAVARSTLFLAQGAWERIEAPYAVAAAERLRRLRGARRREREREREAERLRAMADELRGFGSRGAQRRRKGAERALARLARDPAAEGTAPLELPASAPVGGTRRGAVVEARHLARSGVLRLERVALEAGEKVALLGPNGSGKSTLLALLAGDLASDDPRAELRFAPHLRLLHLDQAGRGLRSGVPLLEQLERGVPAQRVRALLAKLGVGPARWTAAPERLSGGERARAGLARALAWAPDVLLLDEPTNDLDLTAVEALQEALAASAATIVVATHDRWLARSFADRVWGLADGALRTYADIDAYLAGDSVHRADDAVLRAAARAAGGGEPPTKGRAPAREDGPEGVSVPAAHRPKHARPAHERPAHERPAHERTAGEPAAHDPRTHGPDAHGARVEALEDERTELQRRSHDPLALSERERDRIRRRLAQLDDLLSVAYDAALPPPEPRHRLRERGLVVTAERVADGLLVLACEEASTARAMAELLDADRRGAGPGTSAPRPGAERDAGAAGAGTAPAWAPGVAGRVRVEGLVAHVIVAETEGACLLPYARAALVDAAARHAFRLLPIDALQHFSREALPGTLLEPAGDGWWAWSRAAFAAFEGVPYDRAARSVRGRRRRSRR